MKKMKQWTKPLLTTSGLAGALFSFAVCAHAERSKKSRNCWGGVLKMKRLLALLIILMASFSFSGETKEVAKMHTEPIRYEINLESGDYVLECWKRRSGAIQVGSSIRQVTPSLKTKFKVEWKLDPIVIEKKSWEIPFTTTWIQNGRELTNVKYGPYSYKDATTYERPATSLVCSSYLNGKVKVFELPIISDPDSPFTRYMFIAKSVKDIRTLVTSMKHEVDPIFDWNKVFQIERLAKYHTRKDFVIPPLPKRKGPAFLRQFEIRMEKGEFMAAVLDRDASGQTTDKVFEPLMFPVAVKKDAKSQWSMFFKIIPDVKRPEAHENSWLMQSLYKDGKKEVEYSMSLKERLRSDGLTDYTLPTKDMTFEQKGEVRVLTFLILRRSDKKVYSAKFFICDNLETLRKVVKLDPKHPLTKGYYTKLLKTLD